MPVSGPELALEFEPRFCANHVVDLTAGCSFGCVYCPFAEVRAERFGVTRPTPVDVSRLDEMPAPPTVFLSPASDPFAPQAATRAHAVLAHLLPRGTVVAILTKGTIPARTLALLAEYREQIEGVAIGLASLDDARNRTLEPGCPPAAARLDTLARAAALGLPAVLRLDPLIPELDDSPAQLDALVAEGVRRGVVAVTATYVFAWGPTRRRLRRHPLTARAATLLTEKAPMAGGTAWSVPLARKLETYGHLAAVAAHHGIHFSTCGCKDLRMRESGRFLSSCRNVLMLSGQPTVRPKAGSAPVMPALAAGGCVPAAVGCLPVAPEGTSPSGHEPATVRRH
jgi:DNA repair photolyase